MKRSLLCLVVAAALSPAALPAAAGAADYCVAPNTTCGGSNVATFEQALDLADNAADADRIFLGAATYTAPTLSGYVYAQPTYPVQIIGAGVGQTTLTNAPNASFSVLQLDGGAGSSISDLTIRLPQSAAAGYAGLNTYSPARRIAVVEDATETNFRYGVRLHGSAGLEDSTVTLADDDHATGVLAEDNPTAVRGSTVSAGTGIVSFGTTIDRSRVTGSKYAVRTISGASTITASLLRLTDCCTGIRVDESGSASVKIDGVTLLVPVSPDVVGVGVSTSNYDTGEASVTLTNSVIRGSYPLFAYAVGSGHAKITASYSDYDSTEVATTGANASITQANVTNVGGDYHPVPGSPLVDAGDPAAAPGQDLDGNPLVADGNGDGIARRDMGAFELQPAPAGGQPDGGGQPASGGQQQGGTLPTDTVAPLVTRLRAVTGARATRIRFRLSEPAKVVVKLQRRRNGDHGPRYRTVATLTRSGRTGANSARRALRRGAYRAIVVATDVAGNRSTPKVARFRVTRG